MRFNRVLGVFGLCITTIVCAKNNQSVSINGGSVHMRGAITAAACVVSANNKAQIIEMGQLRSNEFDGLGSYAPAIPFNIVLTDCQSTIGETVMITFSGISDGKDPLVLKAGTGMNAASGVGVAIFDNKGEIVPPNAMPRSVSYLQGNDMLLQFTARYRATSRQVTGGNADAWTWFTVLYQ